MKAAEGRNTGDVSEADGRAEETEAKKTQNMTDMTESTYAQSFWCDELIKTSYLHRKKSPWTLFQ